MMLHFAYGSNMHPKVMAQHARGAELLGVAELAGHRFVVTADGYASVERKPGHTVHGVLWRIESRDRATLEAWEGVAAGLYRSTTLPVRHSGRSELALVYIGRHEQIGEPKPGYMEVVLAAAEQWRFPQPYLASLRQWLPSPPPDAGAHEPGDSA
jgi:cation transport regulator ChaC